MKTALQPLWDKFTETPADRTHASTLYYLCCPQLRSCPGRPSSSSPHPTTMGTRCLHRIFFILENFITSHPIYGVKNLIFIQISTLFMKNWVRLDRMFLILVPNHKLSGPQASDFYVTVSMYRKELSIGVKCTPLIPLSIAILVDQSRVWADQQGWRMERVQSLLRVNFVWMLRQRQLIGKKDVKKKFNIDAIASR